MERWQIGAWEINGKCLLVAGAAMVFFLPSCSGLKKADSEGESDAVETAEIDVPTRLVIGAIKGVQGSEFVVFKRSNSNPARAGETLDWVPRDGTTEGGELKLCPERRGSLFIADILSGTPKVGDLVVFSESVEEKKRRRELEKLAAKNGQNAEPLGGGVDPVDEDLSGTFAPLSADALPSLGRPPEERTGSVFDASPTPPPLTPLRNTTTGFDSSAAAPPSNLTPEGAGFGVPSGGAAGVGEREVQSVRVKPLGGIQGVRGRAQAPPPPPLPDAGSSLPPLRPPPD